MKPTIIRRIAKISTALSLMTASVGQAQFNSGSDGSYGPLSPTSNTNLDMPPDGIFHCTTINIPNGVIVYFNRNGLNTPVYLLAQSNVVISGALNLEGSSPSGNS